MTAATGLLGVCHHRHVRRSHQNWHQISTRVSHVFLYGGGKNRMFFRTRFLMKIRVENCEVVTLWPQAYKMTVRVKSFEVEIFYGRWHMKWHFLADQRAEGKRCLSLWIVDEKYSFRYAVADLHSAHVCSRNIIWCLEFSSRHAVSHPHAQVLTWYWKQYSLPLYGTTPKTEVTPVSKTVRVRQTIDIYCMKAFLSVIFSLCKYSSSLIVWSSFTLVLPIA